MIEHHIQKDILRSLVVNEYARYADIKPPTVDGNIFTYHLQQLIKQKFIEKRSDGKYQLTTSGKALGINSGLSSQELLEQAHPIILIVVRDGNKWLLRKRLAQPAYGMVGFVHAEPVLRETISDTASRVLARRTGLSGTCDVRGSGYIKIFKDGQQESFTQFTLVEASNISGELVQTLSTGENIWIENPDFSDSTMLPSMSDLIERLVSGKELFYSELEYHI